MHIPKLEVDRSNWVIFKDHFLFATATGSLKGHIDGTGKPPVSPVPTPCEPLTEDQKQVMSEYGALLTKWEMEENIVKQALALVIPDSLFIEVRKMETALSIWDAVRNRQMHGYGIPMWVAGMGTNRFGYGYRFTYLPPTK